MRTETHPLSFPTNWSLLPLVRDGSAVGLEASLQWAEE